MKRLGSILGKLAIAASLAAIAWTFAPSAAKERFGTVFALKDDYNMIEVNGRMSIWKRNMAAGIARPVGFGLGTFPAVDLSTGGKFNAAHNSLLQVFVELGFLGLFFYVRMFYLSWKGLGRTGKSPSDSSTAADIERIAMSRAFYLSFIGMIVCGFFLSEAFTNLVWVTFALATAITVVNFPEAISLKTPRGARSRGQRSMSKKRLTVG